MRSIRGPSFRQPSAGSVSLLGSLNDVGLGVQQIALGVEKAASVVANDRHRHRPTRGGEHANDEPLAPVSLKNPRDVLDDVLAHAWRLVHRRTWRGLFRSNGAYCDAPFAEVPSSERGKTSLEGDFVTPPNSAPLRTGAAPASAGAASSHLRESNSRPIHYE